MGADLVKAPAKREIDALLAKYDAAKWAAAEAKGEYDAKADVADGLKAKIVEMVQAFGFAHTEKSRRLLGDSSRATTTVATRVSIDDAAVDAFKAYLDEGELAELRPKFFSERVTYQLVSGPDEVLAGMKLPAKVRRKMQELLSRCFRVATSAPSLKVEVFARQAA